MSSSARVLGDSSGRCRWGDSVGKRHNGLVHCDSPFLTEGRALISVLEIQHWRHWDPGGLTNPATTLHKRTLFPVLLLMAFLGPYCMD